jgi:hypothetical protein
MALGMPFKGWLVISKETGEIAVLEIPEDQSDAAKITLANLEKTIEALKSPVFPGRCFEDQPETYKKKPTGNRVLGKTCEYCAFKRTCWPELQYLPAQASTAANPTYRYYTHVENKNEAS